MTVSWEHWPENGSLAVSPTPAYRGQGSFAHAIEVKAPLVVREVVSSDQHKAQ